MSTVKPMLSDYIKQDIFLAFQTGGCLLLYESITESSCTRFLYYFYAAIMCFLYYFHTALTSHLSERPKLFLVVYGRLTQVDFRV